MNLDEKVPNLLKREQMWFGSIIGRPIDEDSRMNPISPSGQLMEVEAAEHIVPSPTLRPAQRIQIYNQQYWWRLLNTLHESFPLLTRLFGYYDFNRTIGIPYLVKYPPRDWSLSVLGDRLEQWINEEYHAGDKELVSFAAKLDGAFSNSFIAKKLTPLRIEEIKQEYLEDILNNVLYIQPYVHVFQMEYDLFSYRFEFLKQDPDYWLTNDFPILDSKRKYCFVLYRNQNNDMAWKEITVEEYLLLSLFKQGSTIDQACQWIENQGLESSENVVNNLQKWFQEWTGRGWLTLYNPNSKLAADFIPIQQESSNISAMVVSSQ